MDDSNLEDRTLYRVVVNQEEQYSIWPADQPGPPGWRDAGPIGLRSECLSYIEQVWTDMRPRSLREQMDSDGAAAVGWPHS